MTSEDEDDVFYKASDLIMASRVKFGKRSPSDKMFSIIVA